MSRVKSIFSSFCCFMVLITVSSAAPVRSRTGDVTAPEEGGFGVRSTRIGPALVEEVAGGR